MFLSRDGVPVYYRPLSFVTHPEYDTAVYSSIAVVKLAVPNISPLTPICFSNTMYDTGGLHLFGYTDDNDKLEKIVYKIQSLENQQCDQFYKKEGLVDPRREPQSFVCGMHQHSKAPCIWENGLVLAANTTGWFTFIGFSLHGPGCGVPARFVFMLHYFSWIESVTHEESARRAGDDDVEVHMHGITSVINPPSESSSVFVFRHDYLTWPDFYDPTKLKYFTIEPSYEDKHAIAIYPFETTQEMYHKACKSPRMLMYQENFLLSGSQSVSGTVTYRVECANRSEAFLTLRDEINFTSEDLDKSPNEVFRVYPIEPLHEENNKYPPGGYGPQDNYDYYGPGGRYDRPRPGRPMDIHDYYGPHGKPRDRPGDYGPVRNQDIYDYYGPAGPSVRPIYYRRGGKPIARYRLEPGSRHHHYGPGGRPDHYGPGGRPGHYGPGGRPEHYGYGGRPDHYGPGGRPSHYGPGGRPEHYGYGGRPDHYGPGGRPGHYGPGGRPDHYGHGGRPDHYGPGGRPGHYGPGGRPEHYGYGGRPDHYGPGGRPGRYGPGGRPDHYGYGGRPDHYGPGGRPGQYGTGGRPDHYGHGGRPDHYRPGHQGYGSSPEYYERGSRPGQYGTGGRPDHYGPGGRPRDRYDSYKQDHKPQNKYDYDADSGIDERIGDDRYGIGTGGKPTDKYGNYPRPGESHDKYGNYGPDSEPNAFKVVDSANFGPRIHYPIQDGRYRVTPKRYGEPHKYEEVEVGGLGLGAMPRVPNRDRWDWEDNRAGATNSTLLVDRLQVQYLHGGPPTGKVLSYDLYIRLEFHGKAVLNFKMFGEPPLYGPKLPKKTTVAPDVLSMAEYIYLSKFDQESKSGTFVKQAVRRKGVGVEKLGGDDEYTETNYPDFEDYDGLPMRSYEGTGQSLQQQKVYGKPEEDFLQNEVVYEHETVSAAWRHETGTVLACTIILLMIGFIDKLIEYYVQLE
ncbi:unnamed protein product [Spodoptera exigua]|nr:unnamed protein product [Spodoptera exigua]